MLAILAVWITEAAMAAGAARPLPGDPRRGAALYQARCGACHSLDTNRIGPAHRGLIGRQAGTVPNFAYSPALKRARIVWTRDTLDRWLTAPVDMVPGTRMGIRIPVAQERADLIAYLSGVSARR